MPKAPNRLRITKVINFCLAVLLSGAFQLLLILPHAPAVKADNFYSSGGDVGECQFASTLGIQYNSIGGGGVSWNGGDVQGQSGNWIQSNNMQSVADITFPDAHRYENLGHHVSVPPNTRVEVGFFAWNYSGHTINVDGVRLFTSYSDPSRGDLTRLGADGTYGNHCANGFGCRGGKSVMTGSAGSFDHRTNYGGRVIYSFDTIQPVQLVSFTASPEWNNGALTVRYDLTLRNVSAYNLGNIRIVDGLPSGATYDQTHSINSGQTRTFTYRDNMGTNYPSVITNDPARIYDNNRHYERASDAYRNYSDNNPETRPAFAMRDDSNAPEGWNSAQPSWGATGGGLISVELIPYNFPTGPVSLNVAPQITHQKQVRDADEDWRVENTIRPSLTDQAQNEFEYRIRVTNNGGKTTEGVVVTDDYDQSLITILDAAGGNNDGDKITWSGFDLDNGETREFLVRARVLMPLPHGTRQALNTITTQIVNAPPGSSSPGPEVARTNIITLANNDIEKYVKNLTAIEKQRENSGNDVSGEHGADADTRLNNGNDVNAVAGDLLEYTLTYRNTGNASSPDTFVRDHLPRYITAQDNSQYEIIRVSDFIDISDDFTLTPTGNGWDIVWRIGDLAPNQEWAIKKFKVRLNPSSQVTLSLDQTRRLFDNTSEIYSTNESVQRDSDNAVIRIDQPNAVITKTSDKVIYQSDEKVVYEITVQNTGSSTATGIVKDTLPDGLVYESSNPGARVNGQVLEWDLTVNAGETKTIEITATFKRPVVDASVHDNKVEYIYKDINENQRPAVGDNLEVTAQAPLLELEKVQNLPNIVAPGQPIIYRLNYRNVGTGYAPNATITDSIPEHTTFVEVIDPNNETPATFDSGKNTVTWNLGQLDPNETGTVSFRVVINIPTESGTEIRNTAVIYSPVVEQVSSEVVTTIARACCAGGNIWEDKNKNKEFDDNEKGIEGIKVNIAWQESEYLPKNNIDLTTDVNGHYSHKGLPYFIPITFTIEMPAGFDELTTANSYTVALLPEREDGVKEDYVKDGIRYVTASGCLEFMNTGMYRDLAIAQTGADITFGLLAGFLAIGAGVTGIYIIYKSENWSKKRRK